MIANARRGEVAAKLDGKEYRLCLTLGALAELETIFAADDLSGLVERFSSGKLAATDMIRILGAGLRAAGNDIGDDDVAAMQVEGGAAGYARIAAELLKATFGSTDQVDGPANP